MVETVSVPISSGPKADAALKEGEAPKPGEQQQQQQPAPKPGEAQQQPALKEGEAPKPGEGEEQPKPLNPAEALKEEQPVKTEEQVRAEAATGLDLTPFAAEFAESGALSEKSYSTLAEKGIPKATVDTYIAGLQAQAQVRHTALAETVGGVENYNALITWGASKLTTAEKQGAVKILSGADVDAAKIYLAGLNRRFEAENGKAPLKSSGGGGSRGTDIFQSRAEQRVAMADPRYHNDPAYRRSVEQKSIRSFSSANAKRRTKKAASKTTHRKARAKGKR